LREKLPHVELYNLYGPTEAAIEVSYWHADRAHDHMNTVPIGRPLPNTSLYVLDAKGYVVADGVRGELHIGGVQVARGYLNLAAQTEQSFIDHAAYGRLYKTGDRCRWLPGGILEYTGRIDDQVKVRGYRIEPGEIEHVLQQHASVQACVVVPFEDVSGMTGLAGYVVGDVSYDRELLLSWLHERLPDYMVPSVLITLDSLPLTASGKVNKRALPSVTSTVVSGYTAPRNETEAGLAEIWETLLKTSNIGIKDNFFARGGHSLLAIRVVSAILSNMKLNVALQDIFNYPTIEALAVAITNKDRKTDLLITLNACKTEMDLFFIPPVMGSSTVFQPLGQLLEDSFNCYGLQYPGFNDIENVQGSIEEIAVQMTATILAVSNTEKLHIAGYSMGALIAFEITKLLEMQGREVVLILLDKDTPDEDADDVQGEDEIAVLIRNHTAMLAPGISKEERDKWEQLYLHNSSLLNKYSIHGEVKSRILAIEAIENEMPTNMQDWKYYTTGTFEHYYVNGGHYDLLNSTGIVHLSNLIIENI
jgi:thioesterase domain-containing protein